MVSNLKEVHWLGHSRLQLLSLPQHRCLGALHSNVNIRSSRPCWLQKLIQFKMAHEMDSSRLKTTRTAGKHYKYPWQSTFKILPVLSRHHRVHALSVGCSHAGRLPRCRQCASLHHCLKPKLSDAMLPMLHMVIQTGGRRLCNLLARESGLKP